MVSIKSAAIRVYNVLPGNNKIEIICGKSHDECMTELELKLSYIGHTLQTAMSKKYVVVDEGFLTTDDRFVNPKRALKIAYRANQIDNADIYKDLGIKELDCAIIKFAN